MCTMTTRRVRAVRVCRVVAGTTRLPCSQTPAATCCVARRTTSPKPRGGTAAAQGTARACPPLGRLLPKGGIEGVEHGHHGCEHLVIIRAGRPHARENDLE